MQNHCEDRGISHQKSPLHICKELFFEKQLVPDAPKRTATLAGGRMRYTNSVSPEDKVLVGPQRWYNPHLVKPHLGLGFQARLSVPSVTAVPMPSRCLGVSRGCRPTGFVRGCPEAAALAPALQPWLCGEAS